MAFKLFKNTPSGLEETSYGDLDNKGFWCALGEKKEHAFVAAMKNMGTPYSVQIHPNKKTNLFYPDLLVHMEGISEPMIGEVKVKNSPLFFGDRYGISPQHALTMDMKDSFNYLRWLRTGVDITIFIWVKWEAHCMETEFNGKTKHYKVQPMEGIWVTKFSKLRQLENKTPPPIHWYKESFRLPPSYKAGQEDEWCKELVQFESRLRQPDDSTKNITSKGYTVQQSSNAEFPVGTRFPAGQSSGSYVFNLQDGTVFDQLV